jgi:hypothetical protein
MVAAMLEGVLAGAASEKGMVLDGYAGIASNPTARKTDHLTACDQLQTMLWLGVSSR